MTRKHISTGKPKGHWTLGKRRNDSGKNWPQTLRRLRRALAKPETNRDVKPTLRLSRRGLSAAIKVSDRTIRRWLAGEDFPPGDKALSIERWIAERLGRSKSA